MPIQLAAKQRQALSLQKQVRVFEFRQISTVILQQGSDNPFLDASMSS